MATIVGSSSGEPSAAPQYEQGHDDDTPLFTCLSCSIAFPNPEDQRTHYRSDLHRYNMKRRVANLPPVKADVFNAKILERRAALAQEAQTAVTPDKCEACDKKFASQNAYRDHLNAKKHKDNVAKLEKSKAAGPSASSATATDANGEQLPLVFRIPKPTEEQTSTSDAAAAPTLTRSTTDAAIVAAEKKQNARDTLLVSEDATEEQIQAAIDAKVATSRRIDPAHECIFCAKSGFAELKDSLAHMSKAHGFFIPDSEYIVDLPGLISYLADKVSIGNICLYCNGRGKGFHNAESVRNHMLDKYHCKIAYSDQEDQLELGDFYDFTSSYPVDEDEEWEDDGEEEDEDMEVDGEGQVLDLTTTKSSGVDDAERDDQIRYGDSELELVLPSGARLGHRSLRRYYQQSLRETPMRSAGADQDLSRRYGGGGALARRLIAESGMGHHDGDGTLVTGRHGQVIKARNRGEAREAKKHITEFRDRNKREQYKTRIGFRNNNQKHFRDPLLQ